MNVKILALALLILPALAIVVGCDDDDVVTPPQTVTVELRYDGDTVTAPNLPAATWEAAARFTPAQTSSVSGGELVEIRFYIQSLPDDAQLKVYGPGTAGSPGALLYATNVTADLVADSWNSHVPQTGVSLPSGDVWVSVEFTQDSSRRVIGCDAGPAVTDGDWLFSSTDTMWIPFGQRFSGSINWNIRATAEATN